MEPNCLVFDFPQCLNFLFQPLVFYNLFLLFLLDAQSLDIPKFITTAFFSCLLTTAFSSFSAITCLVFWIWKFHSFLVCQFSITCRGISSFDCGSIPVTDILVFYSSHYVIVFYICFKSLLLYWTISGTSLHSLHLGSCLVVWTPGSLSPTPYSHC